MSVTSDPEAARAQSRAIQRLAWPDVWASDLKLRVDGRNFTLEGREYVRDVIRDISQRIVIKKAAQTAFTCTFLIRTFHWIVERKWHHLYLLPVKAGAIPFVQSRIDTIINSNSLLKEHFKSVDNRLHKQTTDDIKFLIRGTNIESELQETPVDVEIWDERDRMVESFLSDARRRMDASKVQKLVQLSTPTAPGAGVDSDDTWGDSDQCEWEVPCPHCGRFQVFFPCGDKLEDHVRIGTDEYDCEFFCIHCRKEIKDEERWTLNALGHWVPQNLNGRQRGYHISQFNSSTQTLVAIMEDYFDGQKDAKKLKTFFNQSLGEAFAAEGDQFTPELLDSCIGQGHRLGGIPAGPISVGVDIGDVIHLSASYMKGKRRIKWQYKIFNEWSEVDDFLGQLSSFSCVIDAHPEKREARDLSLKYHGRVWMGFSFDRPQTSEIAQFSKVVYGEASKVVIDKPMAMDSVIKQYMDGNVILPLNARELGEHMPNKPYNGLYHQMIQLVKVQEEDTKGQMVTRWVKNKNKDHWHHADMFEFVASLKQTSLRVPPKVSKAVKEAGSLINA